MISDVVGLSVWMELGGMHMGRCAWMLEVARFMHGSMNWIGPPGFEGVVTNMGCSVCPIWFVIWFPLILDGQVI